jgi:putative flippase GtrA
MMNSRYWPEFLSQFSKYAVVGVLSNLVLFLVYLGATSLGGEPKATMATLYLIGVVQTYFANKKWTFKYFGTHRSSLIRYFLTYLFGFVINYFTLVILVDKWDWPHQFVQGAMIPAIAIFIFILQKFWVFPEINTARDS